MTEQGSGIQHFDGENAHGPVTLFISDDGRLAFVCAKDHQTWELDVGATPGPKPHAERGHLDTEDVAVDAVISGGDAHARTLQVVRQMLR